MLDLTSEQIVKHLDKFTQIYQDGKKINPIPDNVAVTVYCNGGDDSENVGFCCNCTTDEMGLELLIAKSWILEDELQELFN